MIVQKFRKSVAEVLRADFDVIGSVEDGQHAIDSVLKLNPDILIIDISMPIFNGIEVTATLAKLGCKAKVLFLTIHEDEDYRESAFCTGALAQVPQPKLRPIYCRRFEERCKDCSSPLSVRYIGIR